MHPVERVSLLGGAALLLVASLLPAAAMEYQPAAIRSGELWRLWTGQFCHWSMFHLAGNLAAVGGLLLLGGSAMRRWLALLPFAAPLLSLFLSLAAPALAHYRGLSGLVAMLVLGAAFEGGIPGRLFALAYVVKLALDACTGSTSPLLPEGIITAWPAHLGGLLLGLLAAAGFRVQAKHRAAPHLPRTLP